MSEHDAIVIGAGPAGLGVGATLRKAGLQPLILERADRVGPRWHTYYDRLRLQSPRWLTNLPGHRLPRKAGRWPGRDSVIDYLESYAEHHQLQIRFATTVKRIDRDGDRWRVRASNGDFQSPVVVVATGYNNVPFTPEWEGLDTFEKPVLHGSTFKNDERFRGKHVLVVGAGNSGSEIATVLAQGDAVRVTLAVRTPPHVAPRQAFGVPAVLSVVLMRRLPPRMVDLILAGPTRLKIGNLSRYGLERPKLGLYSKYLADGVTPILDTGIVKMLRAGRIEVVRSVQSFDARHVNLADGSTVSPDVVIAATGYRQGLDPLVGHLGVLARDGRPKVIGPADHPDARGLFFIGYSHPLSGNIRDMALDARQIARTVRQRQTGRGGRLLRRGEFDYRRRRPTIPVAHSSLTARPATVPSNGQRVGGLEPVHPKA